MRELPDLNVWENHLKAVFPYSNALTANDLNFCMESGDPVLKIRAQKFSVRFVKTITDTTIFIGPQNRYPTLYLTEQISLSKAESMRSANTPFIDIKGNAFLNLPGLYLFVTGRKQSLPSPLWQQSRLAGKLFKSSGIKLIHLLLTDPLLDAQPENALLNTNMRELATRAGLSTGSVSELISEMKERGFLLDHDRMRILVNRKELFDKWIHGYTDYRLRLNRLCFQVDSIAWWRDRNPQQEAFLWGGEPAAALLTNDYLRPQKLTLYTALPLYDLVVEANLHQTPSSGNVEFVMPLPGADCGPSKDCVHPILVYADLICCSGDERNTETATRIYEKYIQHIIETA